MARTLNGSTQYLELSSAIIATPPFSVSLWFFTAVNTLNMCAFCIVDNVGNAMRYEVLCRGDVVNDPVEWVARGSGISPATSTGAGFAVNTWQHVLGVELTTTNRVVYLNGANKGTAASTQTPTSLGRTTIGNRGFATPTVYFNGSIAEVAVWNVGLGDDDAVALAARVSPVLVMPQALISYVPLYGVTSPEPDLMAARTWALVNSPTLGRHAPVAAPFARFWQIPFSTVAGAASYTQVAYRWRAASGSLAAP